MPSEHHIRFALVASAEKLLARVVTLIIYAERAIQPVFEVVFLRFLGCFQFGEFRVAKRVNAVGRRAVPYERYSIFERAFTPENPIQSINMLERGSYMIYKLATLPEAACLDLAHWKATAHASAANNNGSFHQFSVHVFAKIVNRRCGRQRRRRWRPRQRFRR